LKNLSRIKMWFVISSVFKNETTLKTEQSNRRDYSKAGLKYDFFVFRIKGENVRISLTFCISLVEEATEANYCITTRELDQNWKMCIPIFNGRDLNMDGLKSEQNLTNRRSRETGKFSGDASKTHPKVFNRPKSSGQVLANSKTNPKVFNRQKSSGQVTANSKTDPKVFNR